MTTTPTRRSVLAGIAGAGITIPALAAVPAVAEVPQPEHLTPGERELLDVYRYLTESWRKKLSKVGNLMTEFQDEDAEQIGCVS